MKFENHSDAVADWRLIAGPGGQSRLVVAAKQTYNLSLGARVPPPSETQMELCDADEFLENTSPSVPLREHDWPPGKPHCDVAIHGLAYVPKGRPTPSVVVGLRFGELGKSFEVVGARSWKCSPSGPKPGPAEPFSTMQISYAHAFGGPRDHATNPCGRGSSAGGSVIGQALPNTQELGCPIEHPNGDYRPMSFGLVGRSWWPRAALARSNDAQRCRRGLSALPSGFRSSYHQSTSEDQWVDWPRGGEPVVLSNLTPDAKLEFEFPCLALVAEVTRRGLRERVPMVVDTVVIEPELGRMVVTARAVVAVARDALKLDGVAVERR